MLFGRPVPRSEPGLSAQSPTRAGFIITKPALAITAIWTKVRPAFARWLVIFRGHPFYLCRVHNHLANSLSSKYVVRRLSIAYDLSNSWRPKGRLECRRSAERIPLGY